MNQKLIKRVGAALLTGVMMLGTAAGPMGSLPAVYAVEAAAETEGFSVAFKPDCDLLPEDFPRPCFQMEFNHLLPWVLEEPNSYQ